MDIDANLLQWVVQTGGPWGILTVTIFMFMRRDSKEHTKDIKELADKWMQETKEIADKWREQSGILNQVVQANTAAITELIVTIRNGVHTGQGPGRL